LWSPVDVIAEKNIFEWPAGSILFAAQHEPLQLVERAVNVANCVSQKHCNITSSLRPSIMATIRRSRSVHVHEKMGTLGGRGGWASAEDQIQVEVNVMRKILTALVAAASISAAALAMSSPANAAGWGHGGWGGGGWHGGGWGGGWRGGYWGPGAGFVAGALIGGALAAPYYYGGYPYGYGYGYGSPYGPGCAWRRVWNGYGWVRACV
jgi:hypothetical protein